MKKTIPRINFIKISKNRKTGPIPVTFSEKKTCPDSCPLNPASGGKGCYAHSGMTLLHWTRLNKGETGIEWKQFISELKMLPRNQLMRYGVAGDLPGEGDKINGKELMELTLAAKKIRLFGYTHKPVLNNQGQEARENRKLIKFANQNGFAVNLSANSLAHADSLKQLSIGPVVTLLPSKVENKTVFTPAGNKVVVCPATYRDNVTCASCGLCAVANRSVIVGFPSHGNGIKTVDALQKT